MKCKICGNKLAPGEETYCEDCAATMGGGGSAHYMAEQIRKERREKLVKKPGEILFQGMVVSIQPRIRLSRSFDQRSHVYLGYALLVHGLFDKDTTEHWIGIGKAAQARHQFQAGINIVGVCRAVADPRMEAVEFYKAARMEGSFRERIQDEQPPPRHGIPPALEKYRERGHRRLAVQTYEKACLSCIWGCKMAVEMILDQWKPHLRKYRYETFCYGPKSCKLYKAGPTRKVPGRRGMSWEEEDWVDEEATGGRGEDE